MGSATQIADYRRRPPLGVNRTLWNILHRPRSGGVLVYQGCFRGF
jgi:hypothetical protein